MLLFVALRVSIDFGLTDNMSREAREVSFSFLSQVVIMLVIPIVAMKIYSRDTYKKTLLNFGFGKTSWRVVRWAFVLGLLIYILNIFVASFFHLLLTFFDFKFLGMGGGSAFGTGFVGILISLVLIGVLPGACEESSHRGMLLQSFKARLGVMRAVLLTSILFGFMHMNIVQMFYATILGYLIALAVLATRTIWTGVIMHFMNNAINVMNRTDWFFGEWLQSLFEFFAGPFGFILLIAFLYFVYWAIMDIIHRFAKENYVAGEYSVNTSRLRKSEAIKYYLQDGTPVTRLRPGEKALLCGVLLFGFLVTAFTFWWGVI